jgi:hypothetical protein
LLKNNYNVPEKWILSRASIEKDLPIPYNKNGAARIPALARSSGNAFSWENGISFFGGYAVWTDIFADIRKGKRTAGHPSMAASAH